MKLQPLLNIFVQPKSVIEVISGRTDTSLTVVVETHVLMIHHCRPRSKVTDESLTLSGCIKMYIDVM